jgi:hypothetical protein
VPNIPSSAPICEGPKLEVLVVRQSGLVTLSCRYAHIKLLIEDNVGFMELIELPVQSFIQKQGLMATDLCNRSLIEDHNFVRVTYRTQSVGNDQ